MRQFADMQADLRRHFEETTERLSWEAVHADTTDAEIMMAPIGAA